MTEFTIHDASSAPEASQATLNRIEKKYGAIPGLFGAFAESPAVLEAYPTLQSIFEQKSAFSAAEQQLIFIAASVVNQCHFCVPAHSYMAKHVVKVPAETVEAVRNGHATGDAKLDALINFTQTVVQKRAHLDDGDVEAFLAAGYTKAQVLEVILGITVKTLSNYVGHLTNPPLGMFESEKWTPAEAVAA